MMELVNKGLYIIAYNGENHVARAEESMSGKWTFDSFDFFVPASAVTVLARIDVIDGKLITGSEPDPAAEIAEITKWTRDRIMEWFGAQQWAEKYSDHEIMIDGYAYDIGELATVLTQKVQENPFNPDEAEHGSIRKQ